MLIEGFDQISSVSCQYNYPYYPEFMNVLKCQKEVDYEQYKNKVNTIPERIKKISGAIMEKYNIQIKEFGSKKELSLYAKDFFSCHE